MNLDLEMVKAAAPLILLAIWALSSLFRNEAKPQPGGHALGPRPGGPLHPPGARPGARPGTAMSRDPAMRWGNPPGTEGLPRRPPGRPNEEILIIRSETNRGGRPPAPRPGPGSAPPKRGTRSKAAPATAAKRSEPTSARPAVDQPGSLVSQHVEQTIEGQSLSNTTRANAAADAVTALYDARPKSANRTPLYDLQSLVGSAEELRKAIIVNEVLQPPVAMRNRRRMF
jgi:hypothetical protein